ncbi:MAG TPA: peptide-methionine (S)-S-oxide reductase MsrA [Burkholderiaceae bacterium]|nr:peptide-methionine (S)-S-oxide reductase MsrA [Burkholderiaceae bacterium]
MRVLVYVLTAAFATLGTTACWSTEDATPLPAPFLDETATSAGASETAVLSGGCFWGVQKVFQHVKGVQSAVSGYAGGAQGTAEYEMVSTGRTGHAESVQIRFDPNVVSYGTILRIFFSVAHDPTQVDRQGPDVGTQYRSEIFTLNEQQHRIALNYIRQLDQAGVFGRKIATRIDPLPGFYAAETYHQNFATMHPDNGYIARYDLPKVRNLEQLYPEHFRHDPILVSGSVDAPGTGAKASQ